MLARWLGQFLELTIAVGWTVRMAVAIKIAKGSHSREIVGLQSWEFPRSPLPIPPISIRSNQLRNLNKQ